MFETYTLDQIMAGEGKETIKAELNGNPLYVQAVKHFGYKEIGIVVKSNGVKTHWTSRNNEDGLIEDIVPYANNPDFSVKTKEETLLSILRDIDYVKEHPVLNFFKYLGRFWPNSLEDCPKLLGLVAYVTTIHGSSQSNREKFL